jgi:hypothetical protein
VSKFIGFIVGTAMVIAGILTGNPALIIQGSAMIVSNAILLLTQPKQPARQASEMSIQLGEQPRVLMVGEAATPGSLVDGFNYGGKYGTDWECLVIRLADHKCEGLTGFFVNDEYVPYTGNGNYPQFDDHHFELYFRADTTAEPLPDVVLDHAPGWTAADQGESGCDVVVCYLADKPDAKHPAWPGGRPRFLFVLKGALCYDPRLDDTVDGGAGPHRIDDPATWQWSENAAICRYRWVRGVYANDDSSDLGKLLVGRGLTAEEAPPENIIAPANLCDEAVGGAKPSRILTPSHNFEIARFSPDFTRLYLIWSDGFELWYLPTLTRIGGGSGLDMPANGGIAVNPDYSFYVSEDSATALISPSGGRTQVSADPLGSGGVWNVVAGVFGTSANPAASIHQLVGDLIVTTALSFHPTWMFTDLDGASIALGGPASGLSYTPGIALCTLPDFTTDTIAVATEGECYGLDNGAGGYFVWQSASGGLGFIIDKATRTLTAGPVAMPFSNDGGGNDKPFRGAAQGDAAIWIGFTQYSTRDLSTLRTESPGDWSSISGFESSGAVYDRINNALLTRESVPAELGIRFLDQTGGYRVSGPIYANQDFIDVEGMFAAATGGTVVTREGSVELNPGHAETVVETFTDADLLSGSQVSWNQGILSEANQEWLNTVVARYVEPSQKWQDHAAPVVRDNADIVADGRPREAAITLRLVRYQDQALRVAEINRRLGRLWGRATVTLGPRFCQLEDGDWLQWQSDRYFGGATKTFRVEAYSVDEKWQITLTLREINADVYAIPDEGFPSDQSQPSYNPPPPDIGAPDSGDWTLTATTLDSAGASVPALHLAGAVPADENAEAVIVEYWKDDGVGDPVADSDSISWVMKGRYGPDFTQTDITGLVGGATYYVAVTYVVSGIAGDRLVLGPATVADLDVSGQIDPVVDGAIAGLASKQPVRAKTTAALPASTYANGSSGVGATLTGTSNGALAAQDGVTLAAGDRLLVANEALAYRNGIYTLTQVGDGTHPYILTRTTDADSSAELVGATVRVLEGTANGGTQWQQTTAAPITMGTTSVMWSPVGGGSFATAAEIRAGSVSAKPIAPDQLVLSAVPQTLTDGATINWDMSLGYNAKVTLGGNRTMAAPTNPKEGLTYSLDVIQDGTGGRTLTWNAAFDWGSAGTPTLSTGAGKRDVVSLKCYDAATPKFRAVFNKAA